MTPQPDQAVGAQAGNLLPAARASVDVSIILPVFNEAGHLLEEIDRIQTAMSSSSYTHEIIVVDDGSTDASSQKLEARDEIKVIRFEQNRGSGFARRQGTLEAQGRIVVWTDVDMSYPNDEIPALVDQLGDFDQVVGSRSAERGTLRALRIPAKWLIRKLAGFLTATPIPDLNSGLRAFRRDVGLQYLYLLPNGFSCVTTLTMAFLSNGYSIKYVPISYAPRAGKSKFHWWTDTRLYLLQVVRMTMLFNPLKLLMPAALALLAVAFGKGVFDVLTKDFRIATNTLAILLAALGGVVLSLLADVVVQFNRDRFPVAPAHTEIPPHASTPAETAAGTLARVTSGGHSE